MYIAIFAGCGSPVLYWLLILKLKRTPGIYMVGFMGSGKTTIGRALADELGWYFIDVDEDIEKEQKRTIAEIFDSEGERRFREIESETIRVRVRQIQSGRPGVVALGGGAFCEEVNFELLNNNGVTLWLDCPLDVIKTRLANATHRPLARDSARMEELYKSRLELYARADFRVPVADEDPATAVARILALPLF